MRNKSVLESFYLHSNVTLIILKIFRNATQISLHYNYYEFFPIEPLYLNCHILSRIKMHSISGFKHRID